VYGQKRGERAPFPPSFGLVRRRRDVAWWLPRAEPADGNDVRAAAAAIGGGGGALLAAVAALYALSRSPIDREAAAGCRDPFFVRSPAVPFPSLLRVVCSSPLFSPSFFPPASLLSLPDIRSLDSADGRRRAPQTLPRTFQARERTRQNENPEIVGARSRPTRLSTEVSLTAKRQKASKGHHERDSPYIEFCLRALTSRLWLFSAPTANQE